MLEPDANSFGRKNNGVAFGIALVELIICPVIERLTKVIEVSFCWFP